MGVYLNPGNVDFQKSLNSEIYIDKTELIAYTNKKLNTEQGGKLHPRRRITSVPERRCRAVSCRCG